jgi:hypothetical protein
LGGQITVDNRRYRKLLNGNRRMVIAVEPRVASQQ